MDQSLALFFAAKPGLEDALADEARDLGFAGVAPVAGGVEAQGNWSEVWRANLMLRGAERVLVRIAQFRALHLAQLDKRTRRVAWGDFLTGAHPVAVEAVTRASRIYHQGAARQRVEWALSDSLGVTIDEAASTRVMVRINDDLCTISLDASGEALHRRGHKQAVGKAPLRETMAALFLRQCGFRGDMPVLDPMCGSGTFPIEAAEIASGLAPGRSRHFAFQDFVGFDAQAWAAMTARALSRPPGARFFGSDRDSGAITMARANAERAGVGPWTKFESRPISDIAPPEGPPGLLICNPPYGGRIGNRKLLFGLYARFGAVAKERFAGWKVAIVTSDDGLARTTGLPFLPPGPPVAHGGLTVRLWQTAL